MDKQERKRNNIEKYIIRLIFGLIILIFVIGISNHIKTNDIVETSQKMGGRHYSFDLVYYASIIVGSGISVILILPSLVFLIRLRFRK